MRWRPYKGERIAVPGHRTFIELPATIRFGETTKQYGYVWSENGGFRAYIEVLHPGQIEDRELGSFERENDARRAVEAELSMFLVVRGP